jgi:uncharacterized protein YjbI with pentapeptide repeats
MSVGRYDECHYAKCRYAECCYAECRYAECHYAECHYVDCRYAECHYAECHYAECCYAECRYADCHYAECHYAECRYAECCYAECRYAECRYAECRYAECRYAECHYAECRYADCRYAECRGTLVSTLLFKQSKSHLKKKLLSDLLILIEKWRDAVLSAQHLVGAITFSINDTQHSDNQHNWLNETACLENVNSCFNTNVYSYLETFGGQCSNLYLNVHFFNTGVN